MLLLMVVIINILIVIHHGVVVFQMYGTKLYGSPRSYRKSKYKSKEVIEKDYRKRS